MKRGYFKVYWELMERLSPEASMLLSYLIEVEPIIKNKDGDFFRLSNSFIQETFLTWSSYVIKSRIDELTEKGYIEIQEKYQQEFGSKCKTRWVKITDQTKNLINDLTKNLINDLPEKFGIKDNKDNKDNNNCYLHNNEPKAPVKKTTSSTSSNNNSPNKSFCKESTDSYIAPPTPEEGRRAKRLTRKDQLVNYVNELEYSAETKDVLFKWIFQIGLPKGVTVQQLSDMLKNIWDSCNDESIVRKSIEESYLNNWFGFYPPKTTAKKVEYKPEISSKRADPKNLSDEVF